VNMSPKPTSLTMRWCIDIDTLVVFHAKQLLVQKQVSNGTARLPDFWPANRYNFLADPAAESSFPL